MSFSTFVGLPYIDKGRDRAGVDCWGLVWLIHKKMRGIELPSFHDRYTLPADRKIIANLIAGELIEPFDWIAPGDEATFDCVLMREAGEVRHVGMIIGGGRLIHIQRGEMSRVESYRDGIIRSRIVGFYRYGR